MPVKSYDVVIAGAGPAGCAAAIRLTQLNLSVCLIDDVDDNRLKVGESIPGATIRLLNRLGINTLSEILTESEFAPCTANVSAWGSDQWTFSDAIKNPEGGGWHLVRHKFESALRNKALSAGTEICNDKLQALEKTADGYKITLKSDTSIEIQSKWVIDATGRSSVIAKKMSVERVQFEEQMAAVIWLKNDANQDKTTRIKSVENGWWYSSKLPDGNRVLSFHGLIQDVASFSKSNELFIEEANKSGILENPVLLDSLVEGVNTRNASSSNLNEVVGDSWLAIGDAALSFDPLSSQGIFFALYSGIRSAEAISGSIQSPELLQHHSLDYKRKVQSVFVANQNSRKHFYTAETRFMNHPYWKQYFN